MDDNNIVKKYFKRNYCYNLYTSFRQYVNMLHPFSMLFCYSVSLSLMIININVYITIKIKIILFYIFYYSKRIINRFTVNNMGKKYNKVKKSNIV